MRMTHAGLYGISARLPERAGMSLGGYLSEKWFVYETNRQPSGVASSW